MGPAPSRPASPPRRVLAWPACCDRLTDDRTLTGTGGGWDSGGDWDTGGGGGGGGGEGRGRGGITLAAGGTEISVSGDRTGQQCKLEHNISIGGDMDGSAV